MSLEIVNSSINEIKKFNLPYGFKANLWGKEEPLPVHKFNQSKPDEIGKNSNIVLGSRKEIDGPAFYDFAKKLKIKGQQFSVDAARLNHLIFLYIKA